MGKDRTVIELLRGLGKQEGVFFTAVVKSVEGNTCTVKIGDFPVSDVRLKPTTTDDESTVLLTPAIGSPVLVGSFSGNLSNLFVLQADTVSEIYCKIEDISLKMDKKGIVFNEGKNKGLVNVKDMVGWMQKVYSDLQTLKGLLSTSLIAGNGAPAAIVFNPTVGNPVVSDFENEKVKH